jgi:hypothetical protein
MATKVTEKVSRTRSGPGVNGRRQPKEASFFHEETGLTVSMEWLTPEIMLQYLEKNDNWRDLDERRVEQYENAKRRGEWDTNGVPIIFHDDGTLRDGQHRLMAGVRSGESGWCLVVRGVKSDLNLDEGKTRKNADLLKKQGETDTSNLAATLRMLCRARTFGLNQKTWSGGEAKLRPSRQQIVKFLQEHPSVRESVRKSKTVKDLISPARMACLHYLFAEKDPQMADLFLEGLAGRLELKLGDPVHLLREALIESRLKPNRKMSANHQCAIIVKSWNLWRKGETVKWLRFCSSGPKAEEYPQVE